MLLEFCPRSNNYEPSISVLRLICVWRKLYW